MVGPFSNSTVQKLEAWKISYRVGADDKGMYSPYINLADTLVSVENDVDGVLYLHDDMIINISVWNADHSGFPKDQVIRTSWIDDFGDDLGDIPYRIAMADNEIVYSDPRSGNNFTSWHDLRDNITKWKWWGFKLCIPRAAKMLQSEEVSLQQYHDNDGALYFPGFWQADSLYVPTVLARDFEKAARLHAKHEVFLECALPNIVYWAMWRGSHPSSKPLLNASLCTTFKSNVRGTRTMLEACREEIPNGMGAYHPYKLSQGEEAWKEAFDWVQRDKQNHTSLFSTNTYAAMSR